MITIISTIISSIGPNYKWHGNLTFIIKIFGIDKPINTNHSLLYGIHRLGSKRTVVLASLEVITRISGSGSKDHSLGFLFLD